MSEHSVKLFDSNQRTKRYEFTLEGQFYSMKTNKEYDSLKEAKQVLKKIYGNKLKEVF